MRSLLEQGKIRAIGVSNFSIAQMKEFRNGRPPCGSGHPTICSKRDRGRYLAYACKNGIANAWLRALSRGLLSGRCAQIQSLTATICAAPTRSSSPRLRPISGGRRTSRQSLRTRATEKPSSTSRRAGIWMPASPARLWGARRPDQLAPVNEVSGWSVDDEGKA